MDRRTLGLINGVRHMECPDPAYACEIQYRDRTGNFPFQVFFPPEKSDWTLVHTLMSSTPHKVSLGEFLLEARQGTSIATSPAVPRPPLI